MSFVGIRGVKVDKTYLLKYLNFGFNVCINGNVVEKLRSSKLKIGQSLTLDNTIIIKLKKYNKVSLPNNN